MILSDASPNLVECTIETSKDPHASWSPSPSSDDSRLSFPCLKSLTMTLHDSLSQLDFLNTWEMPVLEQLKICGRELSTDDATHYYVFWEFDNEQPLKKTLLDNLAKNSASLRSVTFEKIPTLAKESILSLIQSSLSLSHLTLIHIPALARDYYQQFFDELTLEPASVLETLSIHVVVDADYDICQFPTMGLADFIVDHGHQIKVFIRLLTVIGQSEGLAEDLATRIEAELYGVEESIWPEISFDRFKKTTLRKTPLQLPQPLTMDSFTTTNPRAIVDVDVPVNEEDPKNGGGPGAYCTIA
ncbi:hypothetical protein BKA70DRAFT_1566617 [Coprinopsis sp. MPI-PUGE-AT-0042]|nr:hypothetical protein BKA70DRAFT_1566617 [Coprinopsis sp. MPI-PUGE-AT-0042]